MTGDKNKTMNVPFELNLDDFNLKLNPVARFVRFKCYKPVFFRLLFVMFFIICAKCFSNKNKINVNLFFVGFLMRFSLFFQSEQANVN